MPDDVDVTRLRSMLAKEVFDVCVDLADRGWTFRLQGHGVRAYCPCGHGGAQFPIPGTPANPGRAARRIRRNAELCPSDHDLIK